MSSNNLGTVASEVNHTLLWTLPTLRKQIGMSRSSIYQQIQAGVFPQPVKLGRSSRWLAAEIQAWVQAKAENRATQKAR
jgi:prophage regulatory protein